MICTKRFLNLEWQQHQWRPRVVAAETLTAQEPDMWARTVNRDYVRCDKQEVCDECGAVRHQKSCVCEAAHAERCIIYLAWRAEWDRATQ
jgi:hypothetical protein